jgi:cytochrome c556
MGTKRRLAAVNHPSPPRSSGGFPMNRLVKCGLALAVLVAPVVAQADDQDIMNYRKQIMQTMGQQAGAMNMTLQGKAPADQFVSHVKTLNLAINQAKKAFEPKVVGDGSIGSAKADVWANWADFSKRLDEQAAKLAALEKAAVEGGAAKAGPMIQASLDCQSCHKMYRVPKN